MKEWYSKHFCPDIVYLYTVNLSEENIVFFDGVCNLCNKSVDWVIRRDKKNRLKYAPLQGDASKKLLNSHDGQEFNSIVFYNKGIVYQRSTAFIKLMVSVGRGWQMMYLLMVFPAFIRDFVYNIIAKNRYKWWGKRDSCRLPTEEEAAKFLA